LILIFGIDYPPHEGGYYYSPDTLFIHTLLVTGICLADTRNDRRTLIELPASKKYTPGQNKTFIFLFFNRTVLKFNGFYKFCLQHT